MSRRVLLLLLVALSGCPGSAPPPPADGQPAATDRVLSPGDAVGEGSPPPLGDGPKPTLDNRWPKPDAAKPWPPTLTKLYTEHLGQLTGTALNPLGPLGMKGTDLGVSFVRDGKLVFLFGDTWTLDALKAYWDHDSAAWTSPAPAPPGGLPKLTFYTDWSGRFLSLLVPTVSLDGMNVPVEGVPVATQSYFFFSAGYSAATNTHSHSVLAHTSGLALQNLVLDHSAPSAKFINVSVVVEQGMAWIFGAGGVYRKSAVHLARVPVGQLAARSAWSYYQGGSGATSKLGPGEASAVSLIPVACVGELSVRRHPTLPLYLMTYNCDAPRGIHLRVAAHPAGPWSSPVVIFDPHTLKDRGYQHFIHAQESAVGHDDGLSEPGREETYGGEYGPYLIPQWFESTGGLHRIVYTLSSWNPYQVHLMRTTLGEPAVSFTPPQKGVGLPPASLVNAHFTAGLAGWTGAGDGFGVFIGPDGKPRLTTHVLPKGDAVVGQLWQDFTVDSKTGELSFYIHGGDATVKLLRGAEVVRTSRGRRTNDPETLVRWRLEAYRGEKLRVLIDDNLTSAWGFVGVRGFTFGP